MAGGSGDPMEVEDTCQEAQGSDIAECLLGDIYVARGITSIGEVTNGPTGTATGILSAMRIVDRMAIIISSWT